MTERPGRRTGAGLVLHQLRYEQLAYWRNPAAAFFTFAFPLMFLVIFSTVFGDERSDNGVRAIQYLAPTLLAFGLISASYTNLAMTLSIRRDSGILKRLRGTPLPTWALIGGVIASAVVIGIAIVAVTLAASVVAYDLTIPARYPAIATTIALGTACFCALGIAVQTFIPNADAAPAVTNAFIMPLLFISGTFFPVDDDSWLAKIASVFPIEHLNDALLGLFDPTIDGSGFATGHLLWLVGWTALSTVVAAVRWRWEPRRR